MMNVTHWQLDRSLHCMNSCHLFVYIFPFQLLNFAISKETNTWNLFLHEKKCYLSPCCTSLTIFHGRADCGGGNCNFYWDFLTLVYGLCVFILACCPRGERRCSISSQYLAFPLGVGGAERPPPDLQSCSPLPALWKLPRKNLWRKFRASRK